MSMLVGLLAIATVAAGSAPPAQGAALGGAVADFRLIRDADVREDLRLDLDQSRRLLDGLAAAQDRLFGRIREAARLRKEGGPETLPAIVREAEGEVRTLIADVLTPPQRTRYEQIKLRDRGPWALIDPTLQARLTLGDDQKRRIDAIAGDFRARVSDALREANRPPTDDAPAGRPPAATQVEQIYEEGASQLIGLLSAEQRATYEALLGDPIRRPQPLGATP